MMIVLVGISGDQFGRATPCPEWTVVDLVVHVVSGNVKYTAIARGNDWGRGMPQVDLGADPFAVYRDTAATMLQAWQQPGALDREIELPRGRGRAELALYIHLGETLVHAWDLAKATGQQVVVDDEVVEASLAQYRSWLPPQRPEGTPFSAAQPIAEDAAPIDRLAAYLGRDVSAWSV